MLTRSRLFTLALLLAIALAAPVEAKAAKDDDHPGKGPPIDPPRGRAARDDPAPSPPPAAPAPSPPAPPAPVPEAKPPAPRAKARAPVEAEPLPPALDEPEAHATPEHPAATAPPVTPTVPPRRLESIDAGAYVAQGRVTISLPSPGGAATEGATTSAPRVSPWAWALPLLGMVGVGAALATARPAQHVSPARPRPALRFANADPGAMLLAGKAAVEAGAMEEAIAWFTQVVKLDPRLAVAHFCRGVCLATVGRHDEAYRALKAAYTIDPAEAAFRLELARAAARTARHQEAMRILAPVLEALPELARDVAEDEAFASLGDHPRWWALTGRL